MTWMTAARVRAETGSKEPPHGAQYHEAISVNETQWARIEEHVVLSCVSRHSQRSYRDVLRSYAAWATTHRQPLSKLSVLKYKDFLVQRRKLAPKSINLHLTVLRRLAKEAADARLIDSRVYTSMLTIPMVPNRGVRVGTWLPKEQARRMLAGPNKRTVVGKRDYLVLMLILRCGLRRAEVAQLDLGVMQEREDRWVLANLRGKGKRVRTLPCPGVVKNAWDEWVDAADLERGRVIRAVSRTGKVWGQGVQEDTIWRIVARYAQQALGKHVAPHDLRRTFGRLCYEISKDLREIQQFYGHSSVQTTERYLGVDVNLTDPVNDRMGLS